MIFIGFIAGLLVGVLISMELNYRIYNDKLEEIAQKTSELKREVDNLLVDRLTAPLYDKLEL